MHYSTISINHSPIYCEGEDSVRNTDPYSHNDLDVEFITAIRNGIDNIIQKNALCSFNARIRSDRVFGITPLMVASAKGDAETLKLLIRLGSDVDAVDISLWGSNRFANWHGRTALYYAICGSEFNIPEYGQNGHQEIVDLLLVHGAKINIRTGMGRTPLHCAVITGQSKIAKALIDGGASVNVNTDGLGTPLHYACSLAENDLQTSLEIVDLLLNHNADINAVAHDTGWTPLHYSWEFPALYEYLVKHGANPNIPDKDGDTVKMIRERLGMD